MTKTSRKWRDKKLKKLKGYRKLHNVALSFNAGLMLVIFLLSILSADNVNKNVILMFVVSVTWLAIFGYANNLEHLEEGED